MATRSNVIVKIKDEDKGKVMKFDINKLPYGVTAENSNHSTEGEVVLNGNYLQIYSHWDGYPEGVGAALLKSFNSYDLALNLVLAGDHSSICSDCVCSYHAWRGEDEEPWDSVKPKVIDEVTNGKGWEEYVYLYDGSDWLVSDVDWKTGTLSEWKKVADVLKENKERIKNLICL